MFVKALFGVGNLTRDKTEKSRNGRLRYCRLMHENFILALSDMDFQKTLIFVKDL